MTEPAPPLDPGWSLPQLAITRDGAWLHDGVEVTHGGILQNLWSNLRTDAEGHYLQVGRHRVPVDVEDAPYVVVRLEREGDRLWASLSDGTREVLDPASLLVRGDVPYCRVKGGVFAARLSRAAAWQLWQLAEPGEPGGAPTLVVGSRRHVITGGR